MEQELNYKELHFDGKKWDEESIAIMEDLLEVWDSGHRIIICHPNQVFLHKPISETNKDIKNIDWLELAKEFSYGDDNSFMNIYPDINSAWKYIHRRFRHELFDNKKIPSPRHLVVIEHDRIGGNLVRGIIRADEQSIKVAESPYYSDYKATSIWDKQLRWTADNERSLQAFVEEKLNPKGSSSNPSQPE